MTEIKYVKAITFKHKLVKPEDINTVVFTLENNIGGVNRYKVFSNTVKFYFEYNVILEQDSSTIKDIENNTSLIFKDLKF